jgi:histone H2B
MSSEGVTKSIDKSSKKGKRTPGATRMNWAGYLHKLQKQRHPDLSMASDAMFTLNGMVEDFKERMIKASYNNADDLGSGTVKSKHCRAAAAMILDGQLLKYTNTEGEKAWHKYAGAAGLV